MARKIWKKTDDMWWKGGPDDPNARVLRIEPVTAELWDGPSSSLVAAYEFAKAKITGEKPFLGENRKKTVPMRSAWICTRNDLVRCNSSRSCQSPAVRVLRIDPGTAELSHGPSTLLVAVY